MATMKELEARQARASADFSDMVEGLDVSEADAERVMRAISDGFALGAADAMTELFPGSEWKPSDASRNG